MEHDVHELAKAITHLATAIHEQNNIHEIRRKLDRMDEKLDKIMAAQSEAAAQLRNAVITINKIGTETDTLIQKVADLQAALENQDNATPELTAAVQAVVDQLKVVDDKVPDAAPVPAPAS